MGHTFSQKYHNRVIQHEAGHFLVADLVGVLPKRYVVSSLDALKKEGSLNLQAGTSFVDFEFLEEFAYQVSIIFSTFNVKQVNAGKVSETVSVFN
ncbi:hypothetical protein RIF29_24373 [Crotalaria pallida]|uniref:Peptidase M41 domain-containing protein n=1 Tax=Crotalaria pallida TaxID=3830 RepID=A0AAN9EKF0_CROPI